MTEVEWLNAHGQDATNTWRSTRQLDDFRPLLVAPRRASLVWFAVACLARIRHHLIPDALHLLDVIEGHAEGRLSRPTVLEAYRAFLHSHYTPRIVRGQGGDSEIDIGEYDSTGCEAASAAAYLVTGDLIYPDDDRFRSTREQFWLAQGVAECCRHAVMATIPVVSWRQGELPPGLEPSRVALLGFSPEQFRQLRRAPELDPTLYAVWQALTDAEQQSEIQRNAVWETEEIWQCDLVREVIQPPFVSCFSPDWRTSDILAASRGIYEERAFDRMPILADALQDAGCDRTDVLDHCRGPGPHVRGCWVVDLVLGKE